MIVELGHVTKLWKQIWVSVKSYMYIKFSYFVDY